MKAVGETWPGRLTVDEENSIDKASTLDVPELGYRSVHFIVSFGDHRLALPEYSGFRGMKFEIQVRTVLQDAWAQISHDYILLSGKADSMWQSSLMGDLVVQRLAEANHPFEVRHVAYDGAGHCSINRCYDSVASDGDGDAVQGMRREVLQFLRRHLPSS